LANPKTKKAIERLLYLLKGQGPIPLEVLYTRCGCNIDDLPGALSSLIEKEEIQIGNLKSRAGWMIAESRHLPPAGPVIWRTGRIQMRKVFPKLIRELKKYNSIAPAEGSNELEKHRRLEGCRDVLDSLKSPFFIVEQLKLTQKQFKEINDIFAVAVEFDGQKYHCLKKVFPGEILIEQLGEISGRYFAPPHAASAPAFLKDHSVGQREAANILGLDDGILEQIISSGEIPHFVLGESIRLWRSDLQELKSNAARLRQLKKKSGLLGVSDISDLLGVDDDQVRRLIAEGKLKPVFRPGTHNQQGALLMFRRSDVEKLRAGVQANLSLMLRGSLKNPGQKRANDTVGMHPRVKRKPQRRKEISLPEQDKLILDDFQIEASQALREGLSVLVSAPTGNGKTLVAEMLAKDVMAAGQGMIYTSPLKALSNQKYRDFKELFGDENVGLVTGDISINPGAPMLIMTTEIFRNWCLSEPEQLAKTSYVVFDEIHYLDDAERGTTWEESILFAPPNIKILGLSATVPNVDEMADWISSVRGGNVVVILDKRRRVPLAIRWFLPEGRIVGEMEARKEVVELSDKLKEARNKKRWFEA